MCILTNKRYETYQMEFSFCHLGHAPGVGLGCAGGSKKLSVGILDGAPSTWLFRLKFRTLVAIKIDLDKQCRPRSDCFWGGVLSGSSLFASLMSILWIPALITHIFIEIRKWKVLEIFEYFSCDMTFPTMWYLWPAKAQTSLCIRTFWSEPLPVALICYDC